MAAHEHRQVADVLSYGAELKKAMGYLATFPATIFVGQAVVYPGQAAFGTFADVPMDRRIEMPIIENFQMGLCVGLSLHGFVPLCFYPRFDFLISACDQLVNHLDKAAAMGWKAKVIIRTAVGRHKHFHLGPQHVQDHTFAMRAMLQSVYVERLDTAEQIMPAYQRAIDSSQSTLLVENMDYGL